MHTVKGELETFELGNEPELFASNDFRPEIYTIEDYVEDWNHYADVVSEHVLKGNPYGLEETRFFQAFTLAGDEQPWTG